MLYNTKHINNLTNKIMEKTKTQTIKKISNLVMIVTELLAVLSLSILSGQVAEIAGKAIALPLAIDLLVRISIVVKPYFKQK